MVTGRAACRLKLAAVRLRTAVVRAAPQRDLRQIDKIMNGGPAVFVVLDGQEVVVAGLVIHPVVRGDHGIGIQRGDDVVHDLLLGKAEFRGMDAIHLEAHGRIIHVLRYVDLADARQFSNLRGQSCGGVISSVAGRGC